MPRATIGQFYQSPDGHSSKYYSLLIVHCILSIVHCPLSIVHCSLSIVHCALFIVQCLEAYSVGGMRKKAKGLAVTAAAILSFLVLIIKFVLWFSWIVSNSLKPVVRSSVRLSACQSVLPSVRPAKSPFGPKGPSVSAEGCCPLHELVNWYFHLFF